MDRTVEYTSRAEEFLQQPVFPPKYKLPHWGVMPMEIFGEDKNGLVI